MDDFKKVMMTKMPLIFSITTTLPFSADGLEREKKKNMGVVWRDHTKFVHAPSIPDGMRSKVQITD